VIQPPPALGDFYWTVVTGLVSSWWLEAMSWNFATGESIQGPAGLRGLRACLGHKGPGGGSGSECRCSGSIPTDQASEPSAPAQMVSCALTAPSSRPDACSTSWGLRALRTGAAAGAPSRTISGWCHRTRRPSLSAIGGAVTSVAPSPPGGRPRPTGGCRSFATAATANVDGWNGWP